MCQQRKQGNNECLDKANKGNSQGFNKANKGYNECLDKANKGNSQGFNKANKATTNVSTKLIDPTTQSK